MSIESMLASVVSLVIAITGETIILDTLAANEISGIMWLVLAAALPGTLITGWLVAVLGTDG